MGLALKLIGEAMHVSRIIFIMTIKNQALNAKTDIYITHYCYEKIISF